MRLKQLLNSEVEYSFPGYRSNMCLSPVVVHCYIAKEAGLATTKKRGSQFLSTSSYLTIPLREKDREKLRLSISVMITKRDVYSGRQQPNRERKR